MFFTMFCVASTKLSAQVAVNLPSDRPIDPLAAFQVCGTVRIDTLPGSLNPTHLLVLDASDSLIHSIRLDSFVASIHKPAPLVRVYTIDTIWIKPPNLKYIIVEMVGAGGGGGGCYSYGGGAGAAGGYSKKLITAQFLAQQEQVFVGLGGLGGDPQFLGQDGGTSSFGVHCFATGGQGGRAQTTIINATEGSLGGTASGGDINLSGSGSGGAVGSGQSVYCGAASFFGGGASTPGLGSNGLNANGYGSGGSGGNCNGNFNRKGGNGADGVVIVTEYY